MSTVAAAACSCTLWDAADTSVRRCDEHHRYWLGPKELASVSSVLRSTWPIAPDFSKADPAVLDNAKDRGIVVDALFSAYVNGTLTHIPAGTRSDAVALFMKLRKWWDNRPERYLAKAQVILADDEIAGTCDIQTPELILDIKATYNVEPVYSIQLGAYASLQGDQPEIGILHVTERFPEPKLIVLNTGDCLHDWEILRSMWRMVTKRTK